MYLPSSLGYVPLINLKALSTDAERARGFMGWKAPPNDKFGMLFKHDHPKRQSYWMKDVPFDLDAIGFDENNRAVEVLCLKANDKTPRRFIRAVQNVVEVRGGWCREHRLEKGWELRMGIGDGGDMAGVVDEAARTPEYASSKNIGALWVPPASRDLSGAVILCSTNAVQKDMGVHGVLRQSNIDRSVIVAQVRFMIDQHYNDLYQARYSSATNKFGPLAYEMLLSKLAKNYNGSWLHSDSRLSADAANVWAKYYERSEAGQGIERKWLGDWGLAKAEAAFDAIENDLHGSGIGVDVSTELAFLAALKRLKNHNLGPRDFAHMWAYRLTTDKTEMFAPLYQIGSNMVDDIIAAAQKNKPITRKEILNMFMTGTLGHFSRLYEGMAPNDVTLAGVLYTEAARTSFEAVHNEMAILFTYDNPAEDIAVTLVSVDEVDDFISTVRSKPKAARRLVDLKWILANKAIVGSITARRSQTDLYAIDATAATDKYGPLLYDLLMGAIYPAYLRSDIRLTAGSRNVWNQMFKRDDVEREWLGSVSSVIDVKEVMSAVLNGWGPSARVAAREYEENHLDSETVESGGEAYDNFVTFVQRLYRISRTDADNIGPFFAYRKKPGKTELGDFSKLWRRGIDMIDELAKLYGVTNKDVLDKVDEAGQLHFNSLYIPQIRDT
jgi:uncharacterized membrane protein (UPF0127 family)